MQPAGSGAGGGAGARLRRAGGILAPGLVDPHLHIESSMMTACAYAEAALLNGTTTVFCDSHEIGNVCDAAGVEWMLEDARAGAAEHLPDGAEHGAGDSDRSSRPRAATSRRPRSARCSTAGRKRWRSARRWTSSQLCAGDARSHGIMAEALQRGRPVSGHVYGREFVAAYAASGVTDTHEAVTREIAEDLIEAGVWIFLRGGPPGHALAQPAPGDPGGDRAGRQPRRGSACAPTTAMPRTCSCSARTGWCARRSRRA